MKMVTYLLTSYPKDSLDENQEFIKKMKTMLSTHEILETKHANDKCDSISDQYKTIIDYAVVPTHIFAIVANVFVLYVWNGKTGRYIIGSLMEYD